MLDQVLCALCFSPQTMSLPLQAAYHGLVSQTPKPPLRRPLLGARKPEARPLLSPVLPREGAACAHRPSKARATHGVAVVSLYIPSATDLSWGDQMARGLAFGGLSPKFPHDKVSPSAVHRNEREVPNRRKGGWQAGESRCPVCPAVTGRRASNATSDVPAKPILQGDVTAAV